MPRRGNRNAASVLEDVGPAPWLEWPERPGSAAHAIRWIETYCTLPKGFGAGGRMRLAEFQKRWIAEILADGVNSAAMSCPRGQGKSTLLAALALWAAFCPGDAGAPQIPVVAVTVQQAFRGVYGVALRMRALEPELESRSITYSAIGAMRIVVPSTGAEVFPVSSDPEGLQGLDPGPIAVCDEIGFQSIDSWDSLLLASGKRPRSLIVGIGTPGFDKQNALYHLRTRVREGASIPGFVFTEYAAPEGCRIDDEAEWRRANPALDEGFLDVDALRTAVQLTPAEHFRIFRLGQWVDSVGSWLGDGGRATWDALRDPWTLVPGAPTFLGIDVGLKRDSTAVVAVQRRDGRWHARSRVWMPMPGTPVDVTDVMQYIRELDAEYQLEACSFDPRFFDVPAKMLDDEKIPMIEVPQSVQMMTRIVGTAYEVIKRGEMSHDGDEILSTHVLNAVPRFNDRGFTLEKSKSRGRIDACIALTLALDRALHATPKRAPNIW